MDAPLLLIADSDPEFRQALAAALDGRYCVCTCGAGREALALLRSFRPHILVLDLMLPELDGFTVLQLAQADGLHPAVLALTAIQNRYICETAGRLNIDYLIRKPCELPAMVLRLEDLLISEDRSFVSDILNKLSFATAHDDCRLIPDAVIMAWKNPRQSVTKELYPALGKLADPWESAAKVEKDIRNAISAAWDLGDMAQWENYFPKGKPTNRKFIWGLAEALDKWKTEKRTGEKQTLSRGSKEI